MAKWADNAITKGPKPIADPLVSWWATPHVQADREAFSAKRAAEERRISSTPVFGPGRKIRDGGGE